MVDDISIAAHETVAKELGEQWNDNEALVADRKFEAERAVINLKHAKEQTALARQKDSSVRAELRALALPYETDSDIPASIISKMTTLEARANETKRNLDEVQQAESQAENALETARGRVALAKEESDRIHAELVKVRNKIIQIAAQKN